MRFNYEVSVFKTFRGHEIDKEHDLVAFLQLHANGHVVNDNSVDLQTEGYSIEVASFNQNDIATVSCLRDVRKNISVMEIYIYEKVEG